MRSSTTITRHNFTFTSLFRVNTFSNATAPSQASSCSKQYYTSLLLSSPNFTYNNRIFGLSLSQQRHFSLLAKTPILMEAVSRHSTPTLDNKDIIGSGISGKGGSHLQETPTKDRFPPAAYDPRNPKRRVAILIDGSKVSAEKYIEVIEPLLPSVVGAAVLVRVFDTELRPEWVPLVENSMTSMITGDNNNNRRLAGPAIEWFRVDRFIPVSMQMAADANHIFEYRNGNKIEGVCYVCVGQERQHYEKYFGRLSGQGYAQYAIDEAGVVGKLVEDGRSVDGVPPA